MRAMVDDAPILARADPRWVRLHSIIGQQSLKRGSFTLSSGRPSNFIFQLRQTTMLPEGAALLGGIIVDYMRRHAIPAVGGLELGAVPLVAAAAVESHHANYPVQAFFVRKAVKAHGARERIDGHLTDGAEVLLVDDVATTGNSILRALDGVICEYPKCTARHAFAVIDREEGAAENLLGKNIRLASVFKKSDFGL